MDASSEKLLGLADASGESSTLPKTSTPQHPSIPQTPASRLQAAADDRPLDAEALVHEDVSKLEAQTAAQEEKTVLYLAYGSNMGSATFRKTRGIVPISQVNVCVPDLMLTFDLPGLPYMEPCFAATQYRDPGAEMPHKLVNNLEKGSLLGQIESVQEKKWRKPLVGIVYEVTLADYSRIIATEGAGSSYIDVTVDCYPFPVDYEPSQPVPDIPDTMAFKAHTLLSPTSNEDLRSMTQGSIIIGARPQPNNRRPRPHRIHSAQPSKRYINLLIKGAEEHCLPDEYREYLASIPYYRITSLSQKVGKILFLLIWVPPVLALMSLTSALAQKNGHAPHWLQACQRGAFSCMWWTYDNGFKPVFGNGERTVVEDDDGNVRSGRVRAAKPRIELT
ncbi:hypothetical protein AJ80_06632 [Polytolypa hystricis UAMH7299]|uniref:gamma-glutamylcyclotransferase n=1 Tax=Polytolypa hystricis (strain UAMH7299) TaxID=1447883 RepID=A0A2B7XU03_POLH7|nr:hypothetical protein AJ80_06632 [Polytolypa hystricis UAMH7299]